MRSLVPLLSAVALLGLASPSVAHPRDPFVPLIRQPAATDPAADSAADPATPAGDSGVASADDEAVPAQGGLPATGAGSVPWLALAYFLIAAGAGIVVLGRTLRAPV